MAGHSLEGLIKWVHRDEWRAAFEDVMDEHLGEICDAIDGSTDDVTSLIGADAFLVVWGCVFEDLLTRETEDGRNIVADYLKRRGFRESGSNRVYMNGLRNSVMSLYEVSDLRPGESFLARDLIRGGEPVLVSERSGSRQFRPWDRIAARIVPTGARTEMGGGVLLFDHDSADKLLDIVREAMEEEDFTGGPGDFLAGFAPLFTTAWLGTRLNAILGPAVPALCNTDGDDILFTTLRYPLSPGVTVGAVRAALDSAQGLHRETASFWNWFDDFGPAHRAQAPSGGLKIGSWTADGSTVLGTVELRRRSVVLEVNSAERAARGQLLLGPLLNGLTGAPRITTQTYEDLKASRPRDETVEASIDLSVEEQQAAIRSWMDDYYRALLDQPVPMLGDSTPRESARRGEADRLAAWLKGLETNAARAAGDTYDAAWIWEELGIAELRR